MRGNQISNEPSPTIIVVFDDLIGVQKPGPPPDYKPAGLTLLDRLVNRLHKEAPPATHWELDHVVVATLQRLWRYGHFNIDVVEFCDQIRTVTALLEEHHVPFHNLTHKHPDHLAGDLAYRPDVSAVYHPYPEHGFKYGARGRLVTPELRAQIGMY